jgi:hypothetical protein
MSTLGAPCLPSPEDLSEGIDAISLELRMFKEHALERITKVEISIAELQRSAPDRPVAQVCYSILHLPTTLLLVLFFPS